MSGNSFCSMIPANCFQKGDQKAEMSMSPSTVLEKYSKNGKKPSQNISNELTKSRTVEAKRKISIRHSMHEKGTNKEGNFQKMDVSEILKV